ALHLLERGIDGPLHALGELVERPLKPREVGEHELVVVAVRDPEDALARRLRLVRDDCHLAAPERVDERRLAGVRAAPDRPRPPPTRAALPPRGGPPAPGPPRGGPTARHLPPPRGRGPPHNPPLVQPLAAPAARRRGDRDLLDVTRPQAFAGRLRDRRPLGA